MSVYSCLRGVALLFVISGAASTVLAQTFDFETRPPRGFMPTADQLVSPVDSIDAVSGNLHLQVPLASMPKGPAGSGFDLDLVYDSHLYDVVVEQDYSWLNNVATTGGWNYNYLNYKVDPEQKPPTQCNSFDDQSYFRLRVGLADGSLHVLHHKNEPFAEDGFYRFNPAGKPFSECRTLIPITGLQTYYTTDGSFLRLQINADGSPDWYNKEWTLFFPDGRKAVGVSYQLKHLYDANGNGIHFSNDCDVSNPCQFYSTVITDDTNPNNLTGLPRRRIVVARNVTNAIPNQDTAILDNITTTGPNGVPVTSTVNWSVITVGGAGTTRRFPKYGCSATIPPCDLNQRHWVAQYIQLPLATASNSPVPWNSYEFRYSDDSDNGFGELNYMRMPSGAVYTYQYRLENFQSDTQNIALYNWVAQKVVTHDGADSPLSWTYSFTDTTSLFTSPDGRRTLHTFNDRKQLHLWYHGLVTRIEEFGDAALTVPLGSVTKRVWAQNRVNPGGGSTRDPNNPYIQKQTITVGNSGGSPSKTAVTEYTYDKNGNLTQRTEYDWVAYAGATVENGTNIERSMTMIYHLVVPAAGSTSDDPSAYWNTTAPPRLDALRRKEVSDGSTVKAIAEFYYDDATSKGNVETEKRWDTVKAPTPPALGTLIESNAQVLTRDYDARGNLVEIFAPEVPVRIGYDTYGNYPKEVKYGYNTTEQRTSTFEWDDEAGVLKSKKDADNDITTAYTYDILGRQLTMNEAGMRQTQTTYDDPNQQVIVKRPLVTSTDGQLQTITQYDQLGRLRKVRTSDGTALSSSPAADDGIKVKTTYRMGTGARVITSTPYRTLSDLTLEWTCTQYDQLGRVIAVAMFTLTEPVDCAPAANRTGNATTVYDSNRTQITDPAGKSRDQYRDGIGRITQVVEAPGTLNYPTNYQYDPLDNLTQVTQADGGITQTRSFNYSSLGRLLSVKNPELGTFSCNGSVVSICYAYKESGDLLTRTDARGFSITYSYDGLHRVTLKDYSGDANLTPDVTYAYHNTPPNKGLLKSVTSSAATTTYNYDALSRLTINTQKVAGNASTYVLRYAYWLNDEWKSFRYPSGRMVTFGKDGAGRVNNVVSGTKTYADLTAQLSDPPYHPDGRVAWMKFGNDLWLTNEYRPAGTGTILKLGTGMGLGDKAQLEYNYAGTSNNGNLLSHVISRGGGDYWQQEYTYDAVNRLIVTKEWPKNSTGGTPQWTRMNGYDRFGNRWVTTSGALSYGDTHEPPAETNFDKNTNRLNGLTYDDAGNLRQYNPYTLSYDAENRLVSMSSASNGNASFDYDGDGRRVKRTWTPNGGTATTTYYFYDAAGRLATEYSTAAPQATRSVYPFTDLLGSVRAVAAGEIDPLVQATTGGAGVRTFTNNVTTGNLLIVATTWYQGCAIPTIADTAATVYTRVQQDFYDSTHLAVFYGFASSSGANTVTLTCASASYWKTAVHEFAGIDAFDTSVKVSFDNAASPQNSGNLTTGFANSLLFGAIAGYRNAAVFNVYDSSDARATFTNGNDALETQYRRGAAAGVESMNFAQSANDHGATILLAFRPRIGTGSISASVTECYDYMDFGRFLARNDNARPGCYQSNPEFSLDTRLPEKFTGKERDAVALTNLDYFGARYYSGAQGRFISPDLPLVDQDPANPQSWNLYSYVRDNPLSYVDPTGQDCVYTDDIDSKGTVSVEQGNCSRKHGTFINGAIDVNSFTWDARKRSLGYNYSASEGAIGTGVIDVSRPPTDELDAKGLAFVSGMAARVDASNEMLATLAGVSIVGGIGVGAYPTAAQWVNEAALGPATGRLFFEGEAGYKLATAYGMGRVLSQSGLGEQYFKWGQPLGRFGWEVLSRFWASGASGNANIFVSLTNPQSLLWKPELPILMNNPNVFRIWH